MRKTLIVLIVFILAVGTFTGCGADETKIQKDFLVMLDEPASKENIKKISEYLDKYLSRIDIEYASNMVVEYEEYILSLDNESIDYDFWANKYEKDVYPALTSLYRIKASEQKNPMTKDAVLLVTWAELAQRALEMESLINQFKDENIIKENATWMFENYINTMIMGTNGTPVFNYKTYEFSVDAKNAYIAFINKNPETTTTWVLIEYFSYLESTGYTMDYNDKVSSKSFFDTSDWLVSEAGKRVYQ